VYNADVQTQERVFTAFRPDVHIRMREHDHWLQLGRAYRQAAKMLWRLELREFPVRADWPPLLGQHEGARSSHPERETLRRDQVESRSIITRCQTNQALEMLKLIHPEAHAAVYLVDVKHVRQDAAATALHTYRRHINRLIDKGWAIVAEFIECTKGAGDEGQDSQEG
jgi:predicted DNA-binding protein (UPF0251 family)